MDRQGSDIVAAKDSMDEIAQVVTLLGVAVGSRPLDEYERNGASAVLEWVAEKLRESSSAL